MYGYLCSSHVFQPYGDTMFEFFQILPRLKVGVIVHVHDIFLPFDYPPSWMQTQFRQYTEQYVLGAFLHGNSNWEVIFPTHYMLNYHQDELKLNYKVTDGCASFWMRRVK